MNRFYEITFVLLVCAGIGNATQLFFDQLDNPECQEWEGLVCLRCNKGYTLNWYAQCVPTQQCEDRQFEANGICHDVSPLCDQYDPHDGHCLSCIDSAYVVFKGVCQPQCKYFEYLSSKGTCTRVPQTCQTFDKEREICLQCKWGLQLAAEGRCTEIFCLEGQVLSTDGKTCIPMPLNCAQYNSVLGKCMKCRYYGYEIHNGECRLGSKQGSRNCLIFNELKSLCFQCASGWRRDEIGVCSLPSEE